MKLDRINKKDLNAHLKESAKKLGFRIWRPYLLKLNSTKINAGIFYFGIFITKGALEKLDKEEQFAILDHEFGHIKRWKEDIFLIIYCLLPLPFIVYSIFDLLLHFLLFRCLILEKVLITIPFLFLFLILRFFKLDYMINLKIKSEFEADKISAELGNAKALISVLQKKKADKEQSYSRFLDFILRLIPRFYFSNHLIHPPIDERIKKLEEFLKFKNTENYITK